MGPKRVKARMESSNVDIGSPEFKTDDFRMYSLKVVECSRKYSHNWTTCPFAHPNEKAKRRDPRLFDYTGVACPSLKQGQRCPNGEHCPYAHNTFEYWLHPSRYRTQLCNIAASCNRHVCFFAHTIEELRVPFPSGSPLAFVDPQLQPQPYSLAYSAADISNFAEPRSMELHPAVSAVAPRAKYVLEQILTARLALGHPVRTPSSDLQEIQSLIQLLRQQQIIAGVSDHDSNSQLRFLSSLFQSLLHEVHTTIFDTSEREHLAKLIHWMYVQMVQNRQSLFSGTESLHPFSQAADAQLDPFRRSFETSSSFGHHQSLSRIPEMTPLASVPFMHSSLEFSMGHHPFFPTNLIPGQYPDVSTYSPSSLDSRSLSIGSYAGMRRSNESSTTRWSPASESLIFSRSSAESDPLSRRSGNVMSLDSSRMSWDDIPPDFILPDLDRHNLQYSFPPGSSA